MHLGCHTEHKDEVVPFLFGNAKTVHWKSQHYFEKFLLLLSLFSQFSEQIKKNKTTADEIYDFVSKQ